MNSQQSEIYKSKSKDTDFRKKWDRSSYEKRRTEDDENDSHKRKKPAEPAIQREFLKARDEKIDLESQLGRVRVVSGASANAGFRCEVCDCVLKDSQTYYDHINGKRHQRMLNMSMKVEHATLEEVQKRLQDLIQQKRDFEIGPSNIRHRLLSAVEGVDRKSRKITIPKEDISVDQQQDCGIRDLMGFSHFSTTKK